MELQNKNNLPFKVAHKELESLISNIRLTHKEISEKYVLLSYEYNKRKIADYKSPFTIVCDFVYEHPVFISVCIVIILGLTLGYYYMGIQAFNRHLLDKQIIKRVKKV